MSLVRTPLIVITGPTASGKSEVALRLAEKWNGEIICADSRTVYRGLDIGTAKPSAEDRGRVRHWLLDVVSPEQRFTAVDFQKLAREAISDIRSRGKIPFLVGGSGLYIDSVVLNFVFGPDVDYGQRNRLQSMTVQQLKLLIKKQRLSLPINENNKRHLIRIIEKNNDFTSRSIIPETDTHVFAVDVDKDVIRQRMRARIEHMFASNLMQETQQLLEKFDVHCESMSGNIYPIVARYLAGEISRDEAMELATVRDYQLAKRQRTWLRRHDYVRWLPANQIEHSVDAIVRNSVTLEQNNATIVEEREGYI